MHMGKTKRGWLAVLLLAGCALAGLAEDAPKPAEAGTLVVVDTSGKEHKIKAWKFTAGTRRLSWLAPAEKPEEKPAKEKAADKDDEKPARKSPARAGAVGPEALVVRDELKIHFLAGVTTLVPLDRVRSITFDNDKETMTVRVATNPKPEDDVILTGTTAYTGINKLTIAAEVDKGEAGIAELTFRGGVMRGNIKEVRFPTPKIQEEKPGRSAVVTTVDKDVKKSHKVSDLQSLYLLPSGREKMLPTLMFRKTLKIDVAKVKKIVASNEDSDDIVWQVTQKDDDASLTLLESMPVEGGAARLLGLIGRVPARYKLFPLRRINAIDFDGGEEKKKDDF
jgi:hypothetical protein